MHDTIRANMSMSISHLIIYVHDSITNQNL